MSFDWKEYLELAKSLLGQANTSYSSEAAERSAVSRAYYAAFCLVRNYAESNLGFRRRNTAQDHQLLRDHLMRGRKTAGLASRLGKLRRWRNHCDHDDEVSNLAHYVQNAIRIAEEVIQKCS